MTFINRTLSYSRVAPSFSSASTLRDSLLASYPDAAYFGGKPVVGIHRGDETEPAWRWIDTFLRQRTDWWPVIGVALQHAVHSGGEMAREALADLLAISSPTWRLLEWTEPLATKWPDARFAPLIAEQRKTCDAPQVSAMFIGGLAPDGGWLEVDIKEQADLDAVLAKSARIGQRSSFDAGATEGPWSWLVDNLINRDWLRPMVPVACATHASGSDHEVRAMLDWLTDEHDLWRYADWMEGWTRTPPAWWNEPAKTIPPGWKWPARGWLAEEPKTLGDIALSALARARHQVVTAPTLDLAPIT